LYVTTFGSGPVTVFWHSLFVDQRSWELVVAALAPGRRVVLIDAPNHGRSEPIDRDFTIEECATAAVEVLDHLRISEPVDWVGNALGGHVGIVLAATSPARVRSLVTIGTPLDALGLVELWTRIVPLVQAYRLAGPVAPLTRTLEGALLGKDAIAAQPVHARVTMDAFRNANRTAMFRAMTCLMIRRRSMRALISSITAPTLMLVGAGGQEGWTWEQAAEAVATMSHGSAATVPGAGHIAPLLVDPALVAKQLEAFWAR